MLNIHNENVGEIQARIDTDMDNRFEKMSEAELDEKIKAFRGRNNEIDEKLQKKIGKIRVVLMPPMACHQESMTWTNFRVV